MKKGRYLPLVLVMIVITALIVLISCRGRDKKAAHDNAAPSDKKSEATKEVASGDETRQDDIQKAGNEELLSGEISNNGQEFIHVGNKTIFRKYGRDALETSALFGEFRSHVIAGSGLSELCYIEDKGTEAVVMGTDSGFGDIYLIDGLLYMMRYDIRSDTADPVIYSYDPVSKESEDISSGFIRAYSDKDDLMAVERAGSLGSGSDYYLIDPKGVSETKLTFEFDIDNDEDSPLIDRIVIDDGMIYMTYGCYEGVGDFFYKGGFLEGSIGDAKLTRVRELEPNEFYDLDSFYIKDGEPVFAEHVPGDAWNESGEMRYCADNGEIIKLGTLEDYDVSGGYLDFILKNVEHVEKSGDYLFFICNRQCYDSRKTVGWKDVYSLLSSSYERMDLGGKVTRICSVGYKDQPLDLLLYIYEGDMDSDRLILVKDELISDDESYHPVPYDDKTEFIFKGGKGSLDDLYNELLKRDQGIITDKYIPDMDEIGFYAVGYTVSDDAPEPLRVRLTFDEGFETVLKLEER